jgi:hypothetical protein
MDSPAESLGRARRRAAGILLLVTLLSFAVCTLLLVAVLYGDWMTPTFERVARFTFHRPAWAIAAATSPLLATLLVGYGYMQRAIRRRSAERKAALRTLPSFPSPGPPVMMPGLLLAAVVAASPQPRASSRADPAVYLPHLDRLSGLTAFARYPASGRSAPCSTRQPGWSPGQRPAL